MQGDLRVLQGLKYGERYELSDDFQERDSSPSIAFLVESFAGVDTGEVEIEFLSANGSFVATYVPVFNQQNDVQHLIAVLEIPEGASHFSLKKLSRLKRAPAVSQFIDGSPARRSLVGRVIHSRTRRPANYGFGFESLAIQLHLARPADAVKLLFTHVGGEPEKLLPFALSSYDENLKQLIPVGSFPVNSIYGPLFTIVGSGGRIEETESTFEIPKGGHIIELRGLKWKGAESARLIAPPKIVARNSSVKDIQSFLDGLSSSDRLACFDSRFPSVSGKQAYSYHKKWVDDLINDGWKVIYLSSDREGWGGKFESALLEVRRIDQDALVAALGRFGATNVRVWINGGNVNPNALAALNFLQSAGWAVVCEYVDSRKASYFSGSTKDFHPFIENKVLKDSDVVVAPTERLAEKAEWEYSLEKHLVVLVSSNDGATTRESSKPECDSLRSCAPISRILKELV